MGQKSLLKVVTSDLTFNWQKNGQPNKQVVELDEEFVGESALDGLEASWYDKATALAFIGEPKLAKDMEKKYIYRATYKDVAVDSEYSYDFLCHVNKEFKIAEGDSLLYVLPMIMITETAKGTKDREVVEPFYYSGGVVRPNSLSRFIEQLDDRTPMFLCGKHIVGER